MVDRFKQLFFKYPHRFGAVYTLIGIGLSYWLIVLPIQQAEAGATKVYLSSKGMMLAEICLLMGLPLLIFGSQCTPIFKQLETKPRSTGFYITVAIIVAMGLGTDFLVKGWLSSKGYTSR